MKMITLWLMALAFAACTSPTEPATAAAAAAAIHYVSPDGAGRLALEDGRFDLVAVPLPGDARIAPTWDGETRLAGTIDSFFVDHASGQRAGVLHVTYVGQVMPGGLEIAHGVDFLNQGLWQGGRAVIPLTDSTAGPVNGWMFRREYADSMPPRIP